MGVEEPYAPPEQLPEARKVGTEDLQLHVTGWLESFVRLQVIEKLAEQRSSRWISLDRQALSPCLSDHNGPEDALGVVLDEPSYISNCLLENRLEGAQVPATDRGVAMLGGNVAERQSGIRGKIRGGIAPASEFGQGIGRCSTGAVTQEANDPDGRRATTRCDRASLSRRMLSHAAITASVTL